MYVNGSTIASKFDYSVILDDDPVVATISLPFRPQDLLVNSASESSVNLSECDHTSVSSQELVSPCGPSLYSNLQETARALTVVTPGPAFQYLLKTSSGCLVCSAVYEGNGKFQRLHVTLCYPLLAIHLGWLSRNCRDPSCGKCQCGHHVVCPASKPVISGVNHGVKHGNMLAVRVFGPASVQ
jgi:hypothetical protein